MTQALEKQEEGKEKSKPLRQVLPDAAELMDEVRALFGSAWANAALREGLRLQREHARLSAERGQPAADAWLAAQQGAAPALSLRQEDTLVGRLPGHGRQH